MEAKKYIKIWSSEHLLWDYAYEDGGLGPVKEPVLVRKLRKISLSDEQLMLVLKAIDTTCHECWDGKANCQCKNVIKYIVQR